MATLKEKIGYGFGDMSSSMFWKIFSYYLPFFYSNIFGLSLADAGVLMLVTRIWDAVSDPMMGVIADRTHTRWGKYRPYLLWVAAPFAIAGILLFTTPDFSPTGKLIWAYVTYILMMTVYTGVRNNLNGVTGENVFNLPWWGAILIVIGMLAIIVLIVFIQNSERRIPVQYAKRVVGRKMYGGQSSHIPLKVNMSGVMPIIFAQAIASLPSTIGMFFGKSVESEGGWGVFLRVFDTTSVVYIIVYFLLIVGFSYFYSTMQFNPVEVANNLKKNGGFIPGFRPGKPTADFIHKVLGKITMFGALYLAVIAIAPIVTGAIIGVSSLAIGGTSVIIVVGVALETTKAMEAQMMMRHYKGFLE